MFPSFLVVGIGEISLSGAKRPDCDGGKGTIFQKSCVWLVRHKHLTQWIAVLFVILKLVAEGGNRFNSNRKAITFWLSQKIGHIRFVCFLPVYEKKAISKHRYILCSCEILSGR